MLAHTYYAVMQLTGEILRGYRGATDRREVMAEFMADCKKSSKFSVAWIRLACQGISNHNTAHHERHKVKLKESCEAKKAMPDPSVSSQATSKSFMMAQHCELSTRSVRVLSHKESCKMIRIEHACVIRMLEPMMWGQSATDWVSSITVDKSKLLSVWAAWPDIRTTS